MNQARPSTAKREAREPRVIINGILVAGGTSFDSDSAERSVFAKRVVEEREEEELRVEEERRLVVAALFADDVDVLRSVDDFFVLDLRVELDLFGVELTRMEDGLRVEVGLRVKVVRRVEDVLRVEVVRRKVELIRVDLVDERDVERNVREREKELVGAVLEEVEVFVK